MIFFIFILSIIDINAKVISEDELKKSILLNFPLIEEAQMKVKSSEGDVTSSQGAFDFKLKGKHRNHIEDRYDNEFSEISIEKPLTFSGLSLQAGHRTGTGVFAPYEGKYDTSTAGELFAGLSLPLLQNRSIDDARLGREFAHMDKSIAENELVLKKNLYLHKGLSLFLKWRLAHQTYATLKDLINIAEEREVMLEKRLKAGDVEKIKILDNQRSILKRKSDLLASQMDLKKWAMQLSLYFRDEKGNSIDITDYKPEDKIKTTFNYSALELERLPQLKILDTDIERNRRKNELAENQKLPTLNVEAIASRELSPGYPYDPQRVHVGVVFQYPLENNKAEGKTVSSLYKGKALEKKRQWIEAEFTNLYKQTLEIGKLTQDQSKTVSQELENSKILADAERKRWARGDSDLFIVALREQDAADVEIKHWKVEYELNQNMLDAQLYSATLFQDSI